MGNPALRTWIIFLVSAAVPPVVFGGFTGFGWALVAAPVWVVGVASAFIWHATRYRDGEDPVRA